MAVARYADVVIRQGGRAVGTFSYSVPPALRSAVVPGQVVWVPFRRTRLPAIVVALSEQAPDLETRDIVEIADPTPVLTPHQIALGRWMAEHYLCTLAEALFAMLPPGLLGRTRTRVVLTESGWNRPLEGLPPLPRRAIEGLRRSGGESDLSVLARMLRRKGLGGTISRLEREGWLQEIPRIEEPTARPHREPFLVLSADPAEAASLREKLLAGRRNSPAARLLSALARSPGGIREIRTLCREVRAELEVIAELEAEGLVRSLEEEDRFRLVASEEEAASFLEKEARRFPRGCALLRRLQGAGGVLDRRTASGEPEAESVPTEVWRALERRGLVRRECRPAQVRLSVLPEVALARAAALRRTRADERLLALLERLEQAEEKALPLSVLGREEATALLEAGVARIEERERLRDPLAGQEFSPEPPPPLTEGQGRAWREIYEAFGRGRTHVFLLHGVTGSGKTEIYLRALGRALREGRQAVVLVPEISLTPQTVRRFAARFPGRVTVLHSGLSVGERYDQWRRVRAGQVDVVIGPRSALFAPLPGLGLIIIDEEHDDSYKQDDPPPRYHARETALALARLTGSIVILGSATPSIESYSRAARDEPSALPYRLLELPERIRVREDSTGQPLVLIQTALPRVEVVDMREELRAGNTSIFSRSLRRALRETLSAGEQAILFLNRRGAATFVMCRDCGYVVRCPHCKVPYVYHADLGRLLCHRCGRKSSVPTSCPVCRSIRIRHFGAGTERVESEVLRLLPSARVLRWDRDVADARGDALEAFARREADVLVGTQMVAKGLDLPGVSLVGVVSADTVLHLPDFRSAERTFQLVTQVIGRAGRREERGRAIIQTYHPDHYAIRSAARQDYAAFFRQEMAFRARYGYPPFRAMARLVYSHSREDRAQEEAGRVAHLLAGRVSAVPGARLVGPAPAFVLRRHGRYRWQILLLAPEVQPLLQRFVLPEGWSVDVDPVSLLS